ncbi:MAG: XdhC family protein [Candidatus Latescibacteria bacterium]|nr:XdhC family protein [Candidatus Latescibacterota bacterium]
MNQKIQEIIEKNIPAYLVTITSTSQSTPTRLGAKMLVYTDRKIYGTIGGGDLEKKIIDYIVLNKPSETIKLDFALSKTGNTNMVCGGDVQILVERLFNPCLLYIIGAGHCGVELSQLAKKVGFYVTVIDNRKAWANQEKHPFADKITVTPYKNIQKHINFTDNTYIVIMTHNHEYDELVLKKCLRKKYKYLGMIGSKNKVKQSFQNLSRAGYSKKELNKIYAPIGLNIGSITPAEIAISISAQLIAVKNSIFQ